MIPTGVFVGRQAATEQCELFIEPLQRVLSLQQIAQDSGTSIFNIKQ